MKKIKPQPATSLAARELMWLSEKKNNTLDESGLTDIFRLLISKVNQLSDEVDFLRRTIDQL